MKVWMSFLLVFAFFGCAKTNTPEPTTCIDGGIHTYTVPLNNCVAKDSSGNSLPICFLKVDDSRCPAVCVWEGVAIGDFTMKVGTNIYPFTLATKKFFGMPSTDTIISGYRIKLINITPAPGTSTEPTRAILQIQ